MSKQTAVEWLVEQIEKDENVRLRGLNILHLLEQAKQMHKKEIMKVVMDFGWSKEKADKYYNETYGGNNE